MPKATNRKKKIIVVSGFSGIGGMDTGFSSNSDFKLIMQIENGKDQNEILTKNFPKVKHRVCDINTLKTLPKGTDVFVFTPPCNDASPMFPAGDGINGPETGKIRISFRILKETRDAGKTLPSVILIEEVLGFKKVPAMIEIAEEFKKLGYEYLVWRQIDLLGVLPQSRRRIIIVATRGGISAQDILFQDNPECKCRKGATHTLLLSSSSSEICALCHDSEDAETIQNIAVAVNYAQKRQAPTYHKIPCLLTSSGSMRIVEYCLPTRNENDRKRKREISSSSFISYDLDIRDMERLMGFPENYTKLIRGGRGGKNDAVHKIRRLKCIAKAFAVPHSEWLAKSISMAFKKEKEITEEANKERIKNEFFLINDSNSASKGQLQNSSSRYPKRMHYSAFKSQLKNLERWPSCGMIDLSRSSELEILYPRENIHEYPILKPFKPLAVFLKHKDVQKSGNWKRLFNYMERLLSTDKYMDSFEYWVLKQFIPDDKRRRGILRRFSHKVSMVQNTDTIGVPGFHESILKEAFESGDCDILLKE